MPIYSRTIAASRQLTLSRFSSAIHISFVGILITSVTRLGIPANIQSETWEILRSSTPGSGRP